MDADQHRVRRLTGRRQVQVEALERRVVRVGDVAVDAVAWASPGYTLPALGAGDTAGGLAGAEAAVEPPEAPPQAASPAASPAARRVTCTNLTIVLRSMG